MLQRLPATRARIRRGVQTFDAAQLLRRGRAQIGGPAQVHTTDALGVGPGARSGLNFGGAEPALQWLNEPRSADSLARRGGRVARLCHYEPHEEALMQRTRGLALLDPPTDAGPLAMHLPLFEPELSVLEEAGRIEPPTARLSLTDRGMFFADSVAGLLAARSTAHRRAVGLHEPAELHMG